RREEPLAPQVAPALDRILPVAVVLGRTRRDLLAGQLVDAIDELLPGGIQLDAHYPAMPLPAVGAGRADRLQRHVPIWCSSTRLPCGSSMKICSSSGPVTLLIVQYFTPRRSSSCFASCTSGTARATWRC